MSDLGSCRVIISDTTVAEGATYSGPVQIHGNDNQYTTREQDVGEGWLRHEKFRFLTLMTVPYGTAMFRR